MDRLKCCAEQTATRHREYNFKRWQKVTYVKELQKISYCLTSCQIECVKSQQISTNEQGLSQAVLDPFSLMWRKLHNTGKTGRRVAETATLAVNLSINIRFVSDSDNLLALVTRKIDFHHFEFWWVSSLDETGVSIARGSS